MLLGWSPLLFAAGERHLTPSEAAALALVGNPALAAARDAKAAAAAERVQAGTLPNPSLAVSGDRVTGRVHDVRENTYSVGVDWEVTKLLALGPNLRAADASFAAASLGVTWAEFQAAEEARWEIVRVALAEKALAVAREAEADLQASTKNIRAAGPNESSLTLAAAEAAASQAKVARLEQEQALADERLALNAALGLSPEEKVVPDAESALVALHSKELPKSAEIWMATLEQARPDLLALQMGRQSQDAKLRAAVLARFPAVSLGVQQARDTGDITTRGVTLTVSVPIFDRNQGAVAAERATRQTLADEWTNRLAEARSAVAKAWVDFRSLRQQIEATEASLSARRKLASALEQSLQEHGVDAATVYSARSDVTTSQSDLVKLEVSLTEAAAAVDLATGKVLFP